MNIKNDKINRKIALIPVDGRPITYDMPTDLGSIVNWEVVSPDRNILGFLKKPANLNKLQEWIEKIAPTVDAMVVSMDMILYGGLVPSRINSEDSQLIEQRLKNFINFKKNFPSLKIMAFSSTMRISNNYVNIEEKDYWSEYGEEIWAYSYYLHKYKKQKKQKDYDIYTKMNDKIPVEILKDYQWTRNRNFKINTLLINYLEKEQLDLLVFPQDDTSKYGLNIMEQEKLKETIRNKNLINDILIYPGADEVASLLIARTIYILEGERFPTYYPIYNGINGALSTANYEDRIIDESVKGQIYALGSHTVENIEEADIVLGVNVPGEKQGEIALSQNLNRVDTNNRNIGEWLRKLKFYNDKGKSIAIVDVAYANGADMFMIPQLLNTFSLKELFGFAAWNTAGNTIGTVVAQSALFKLAEERKLPVEKTKEKIFLLRLLDDYLYQSIIRQKVRSEVDENEVNNMELLAVVKKNYLLESNKFINDLGLNFELEKIYLPWNRTFEIGMKLNET